MKIMVGYDGSKIAKEALSLAKKHATAFGARVHVVNSFAQTREVTDGDVDKMEKANRELELIEKSCAEAQIPCTILLLVNTLIPGENLIKYAAENDIDEIVIGVRKRSKVGKLVFGSTAQYVILEASCPVVAVKGTL